MFTISKLKILLICLLIISCSPLKQYKKLDIVGEPLEVPRQYLNVSLESYPVETSSSQSQSLFDLDAEGQEMFIEASNQNDKTAQQKLLANLKSLGAKSKSREVDKSRIKTKLVFTVDKPPFFFVQGERNDLEGKEWVIIEPGEKQTNSLAWLQEMYPGLSVPAGKGPIKVFFHNENDRIKHLKINFNRVADGLTFENWSLLNTKYGTANLGQITQENSGSAKVGGSFTRPKQFVDLDTLEGSFSLNPEVSLSAKRTEAITLTDRFVDINGKLKDDGGEIVQEGVLGRDVAGNITVDVTIKLESEKKIFLVFSEKDLYITDEKGKILKDKFDNPILKPFRQIGFGYYTEHQPLIELLDPSATRVDYSYSFITRDIVKKARTFSEADDQIKLKYGVAGGYSNLVSETQMNKYKKSLSTLYGLYYSDNRRFTIQLGDPNNDIEERPTYPLYFRSYEDAHKFRLWYSLYINQQFSEEIKKDPNVPIEDIGFSLSKSNMNISIEGDRSIDTGDTPRIYVIKYSN